MKFRKDGWIHTGDMVEVFDDRVMFRGRVDNVINIGGAKVTPEEVEAAGQQSPLSPAKAIWKAGLRIFESLKPELAPDAR